MDFFEPAPGHCWPDSALEVLRNQRVSRSYQFVVIDKRLDTKRSLGYTATRFTNTSYGAVSDWSQECSAVWLSLEEVKTTL